MFLSQDFVGDLAKVLTDCDNEKFMVECLGILANLSLPDLDYSSLLQEYNLIPWIRNVLIPGNCDGRSFCLRIDGKTLSETF